MISVYVGGLVAGAAYDSFELLLAMITTFFITGASMTFNDYFDWEIDKINHPERPIPQGIIQPKEMLAFSVIFFVFGVTISFFINLLCFGITIGSVFLLNVYELYSKNVGIFSNFTVAFISALSFTFGGAAVGNPGAALILSVLTFFVMVGREIIMDIRDAEGDQSVRRSLPVQLGKTRASYVAILFLVISVVLAPLPYFLNILNLWYVLIIIPVAVIILATVLWMLRDTQKAALSASLIRVALAIALVAFIVGILL